MLALLIKSMADRSNDDVGHLRQSVSPSRPDHQMRLMSALAILLAGIIDVARSSRRAVLISPKATGPFTRACQNETPHRPIICR
jgi:hypothetical protein